MEQYIISNTTGTSRNTKDASRVPPKTSAQTPSAAESISTKIEQDEDLQKWRKSVNRNGGETNANISTLIFCHFEALWDDFSSWARLYGLGGAIIMVIFGKKSIWKTQLEVLHSSQLGGLGSPGSGSRIGGSGDPGGDPLPGVGGGGGGNGPGGDGDPGWPDSDYICDQAAQEFKNLVQVESTRISLSGTIVAAIATAAIILPNLSKSHWVARAFWLSSLVTSLLAVYYAGNLVWKVGRLLSGFQIRAWIRSSNKSILDIFRGNSRGNSMLRMLIPALSAVLAVSAPGVLLSASVLFLLLGFGIYLGFVWSRALDADAGKGDSRDVFIVYIIVLAVVYMVYTLSDIYQDYGTDATVRGAIERTINKMQLEWPEIIRARAESYIERQKDRDIQQQQLATLTEILQVKYDNKRIRAEMGGIPPDETETADVQ